MEAEKELGYSLRDHPEARIWVRDGFWERVHREFDFEEEKPMSTALKVVRDSVSAPGATPPMNLCSRFFGVVPPLRTGGHRRRHRRAAARRGPGRDRPEPPPRRLSNPGLRLRVRRSWREAAVPARRGMDR
ncbi:hypothetical protein GCM10029992_01110 [Glycomyces albus]